MGLTLTRRRPSSHDTIGVAARVGASTRFKPVIHAWRTCQAASRGATLRISQQRSLPHGTGVGLGSGVRTRRFRS